MDVRSLTPLNEDRGVVVTLRDFSGATATITVAGTYSERYRDAMRAARAQYEDAMRRGVELTDDERDQIDLAVEAQCILSWSFVSDGGPLAITADTWGAIAKARPNWRLVVQREMSNHERFFAESSRP
jgi:hypothetical protein